MASKGGVNIVKFFFYAGNTIEVELKHRLVSLAYATARDLGVAPVSILIRSDLHTTTSRNGRHVMDPRGYHATFALKFGEHVEKKLHVASHGYTTGKGDYILKEATHTSEKPDETRRGAWKDNKIVWPAEEDLEEYKSVAYSHLPDPGAKV